MFQFMLYTHEGCGSFVRKQLFHLCSKNGKL